MWEHRASGHLLYPTSWVTDLDGAPANLAGVVQIGRPRWQIETEQVNGPKHQGSELTHTSGQGQPTLSLGVYLLTLLASVAHVRRALGARLSQRCRAQESRREVWAAWRALLKGLLGESWAHLWRVYLAEADASP